MCSSLPGLNPRASAEAGGWHALRTCFEFSWSASFAQHVQRVIRTFPDLYVRVRTPATRTGETGRIRWVLWGDLHFFGVSWSNEMRRSRSDMAAIATWGFPAFACMTRPWVRVNSFFNQSILFSGTAKTNAVHTGGWFPEELPIISSWVLAEPENTV